MNELVTFAKKKAFKIQNAIKFQQKVTFRTFCNHEKGLIKRRKHDGAVTLLILFIKFSIETHR